MARQVLWHKSMISRHQRLALWEAFRRIPPKAPHGSNRAAWLLTSAIARTGAFEEMHVFVEPENAWPLELPTSVPCAVFEGMSLPAKRNLYAAIYLSGNHYIVGNYVFMLRPLHDWAPIVCEIGTSHNLQQWSSLLLALLSGTLRATDALILKSQATKKLYARTWQAWRQRFPSVPTPSLVVLPNGVDADEHQHSAELRRATRAQLGLTDDQVAFLGFSRIAHNTKGDQRSLIALWRQVVARAPKAVLILSGQADSTSIGLNLSALARNCGVANHVIILANPYQLWPNAQPRLMSAADLFVNVTTGVEETFPLTALEAMSYGLPVIGTRWAGLVELIRDGENGFLIDTLWAGLPEELRVPALACKSISEYYTELSKNVGHDARQFIQSAVALATNAERRRQMGAMARQTIEQNHRIESVALARVRLLKEVSQAAERSGAPAPRTLLLDAEWILGANAARELTDGCGLQADALELSEFLPEAGEPLVRQAIEQIVACVARQPGVTLAALCHAMHHPLVDLKLTAADDADKTRALVRRLVLRLMNYCVLNPISTEHETARSHRVAELAVASASPPVGS